MWSRLVSRSLLICSVSLNQSNCISETGRWGPAFRHLSYNLFNAVEHLIHCDLLQNHSFMIGYCFVVMTNVTTINKQCDNLQDSYYCKLFFLKSRFFKLSATGINIFILIPNCEVLQAVEVFPVHS